MSNPYYPQQPGYPAPPQPGYPQAQPGYGNLQPGYPVPQYPQPGYPAQGQVPPAQFDFGDAFAGADVSGGPGELIDKGTYDAVVAESEWGQAASSGNPQWRVVCQITTGKYAGMKRTTQITLAKVKADGSKNEKGMGLASRQLHALGIPVPPYDPQPFWARGITPEQVAQSLPGRPCQIRIRHDDSYDGTMRDKVAEILAPRPGAPTQVEQAPAQQAYAPPQGYPQPGYGPQPGYPASGPQAASYQPQQPYSGPQAPQPWQQPGPPVPPAPSPQYAAAPGAPPQTAPPPPSSQPQPAMVPGAGGTDQFTPQGQAVQDGQQGFDPMRPPWAATT